MIKVPSATSTRFRRLSSIHNNLLLVDYAGCRGSLQAILGLNSYHPTKSHHSTYLFNTLTISNLPVRGVLPSTCSNSITNLSDLLLLLGAHITVGGTSSLGLGQDTRLGNILMFNIGTFCSMCDLGVKCASIVFIFKLLHICYQLSFNYLILFINSKSINYSVLLTHFTWNWIVGYRKWGIRFISPSGFSFGIRGGSDLRSGVTKFFNWGDSKCTELASCAF